MTKAQAKVASDGGSLDGLDLSLGKSLDEVLSLKDLRGARDLEVEGPADSGSKSRPIETEAIIRGCCLRLLVSR